MVSCNHLKRKPKPKPKPDTCGFDVWIRAFLATAEYSRELGE